MHASFSVSVHHETSTASWSSHSSWKPLKLHCYMKLYKNIELPLYVIYFCYNLALPDMPRHPFTYKFCPVKITQHFTFLCDQPYAIRPVGFFLCMTWLVCMCMCVYVCVQAWSITYVSWLTFVFLLWSCMLWMVRDRRRYAMLSSPFMVAYGNLVLLLQYIWSIERVPGVPGLFLKTPVPFSSLGSKVKPWQGYL